MSKNILLVTGGNCGGAERMTLLYGKILEKIGFNIRLLLCVNSKDNEITLMPFVPKEWKTKIISCRYRYLFINIWNELRKCKEDIVFCSMPELSMMLIVQRFLHVFHAKIIIRHFNMPSILSKKINIKCKLFYRFADIVIAQTKEMKEEMEEYYHLEDSQITVINNPIDKDLIQEKIKDDFPFDHRFTNYVAVGQVAERKDYKTLLNAFKIAHSKNPQLRLYIVGKYSNDAYYKELEDFVANNELQESIIFEGFQDNPFKYVNGADAFCLSSIFEGLPNGMIEAMYLGKPVVVTKSIPFITQVVHDGENGYTAETGDAETFAKGMLKATELKNLPRFVDVNHSEKLIVNLFKTTNASCT